MNWFAANMVPIQTTLIYTVLALSFHLVLRSGVFSFASVGFFGLGGYGVAAMTLRGVPGPLALIIVLAGAGILGLLLGMLLRKLRGLYLGLFTIAFDLILVVFYRNGGELTGGTVGLFGVPEILPFWALVLVTILVVILVWRLSRASLGRSFEAIRLNENVARSVGIEVTRRRITIFAISAVLGALAGVMNVSVFTTVTPTTASFHLVTLGLTMVVLGGIASWQGALVGAILIAWLSPLLGPFQQYQIIINGVLIMLIVVFAPTGLAGLATAAYRRIRRGAGKVEAVE